jgi:hypothetical protein
MTEFLKNIFITTYAQGGGETGTNTIVHCGNPGQSACTINDIFITMNQFSGFLIKVIFPALFFFGLFMVLWPLINQFQNESANALNTAKQRAKMLVVGSGFVIGAFLIVRAILAAFGYKDLDTIDKTTYMQNFIKDIFPTALAQSSTDTASKFPNPLADSTIQDIILSIANVLAFIIIIFAILGIVRGVMYLLLTQESPENLQKGKKWIFWSLIAVAATLGAELFINIIQDTAVSIFKS